MHMDQADLTPEALYVTDGGAHMQGLKRANGRTVDFVFAHHIEWAAVEHVLLAQHL